MTTLPTYLLTWPSGDTELICDPDSYDETQCTIEPLPDGFWAQAARDTAMANIRTWRDAELTATDWTQMADQSDERKSLWAPYRQALRDYPDTITDPLNPPARPERPA